MESKHRLMQRNKIRTKEQSTIKLILWCTERTTDKALELLCTWNLVITYMEMYALLGTDNSILSIRMWLILFSLTIFSFLGNEYEGTTTDSYSKTTNNGRLCRIWHVFCMCVQSNQEAKPVNGIFHVLFFCFTVTENNVCLWSGKNLLGHTDFKWKTTFS